MAYLIYADDTSQTQRAYALSPITAIGSAPSNDVQLNDNSVLPFHARVSLDGGELVLNVVDPKAFVTLNGTKVQRTKLKHGDRIQLGTQTLTLSLLRPAIGDREPMWTQRQQHALEQLTNCLQSASILAPKTTVANLLRVCQSLAQAERTILIDLEPNQPCILTSEPSGNLPALDAADLKSLATSAQHALDKGAVLMLDGAQAGQVNALGAHQPFAWIPVSSKEVLVLCGHPSAAELTNEDQYLLLLLSRLIAIYAAHVSTQPSTPDTSTAEPVRWASSMVGSSAKMRAIGEYIERIAPSDVSVLVTGETGTGKELVAQAIHQHSARAKRPLISVNCGAIAENLIESELFGHVKGAFTGAIQTQEGKFQAAQGGTLFLDEIGELPLPLQVKLLRALQEKVIVKVGSTKVEPVDIRIVAATNRNLADEVAAGRFREDLYYRLNVVQVHLPPLRERGDDVIDLARYFINKHGAKLSSKVRGFTPAAHSALLAHPWPGNIRELENKIQRALVMCQGQLLSPSDLELSVTVSKALTLAEARDIFLRAHVLDTLKRHDGNRAKAAKELDIDPRTLYRYIGQE